MSEHPLVSRRPLQEAPPLTSNLVDELQVLCQSPAFTAALQSSPLATHFTQQLSPVHASPLPASDFHASTRCTSLHLSRSLGDTVQVLPGVQHTWDYHATSSKTLSYFSPDHFSSWTPPNPLHCPSPF